MVKKSESRPKLLPLVIFMLMMFVVLASLALFYQSWRVEQDFARMQTNDKRYYRNLRQVEALKTLEDAIVLNSGSVQPSVLTGEQLLAKVPGCREEWGPPDLNFIEKIWATLKGQTQATETPADRLAMRVTALQIWLNERNRHLKHPLMLDLDLWSNATSARLQQPLLHKLPDGSQKEIVLSCKDIAQAMRKLIPEDCRQSLFFSGESKTRNCPALEGLNLRERMRGKNVQAHFPGDKQQVEVPAPLFALRNPWRGVPGCVYWRAGDKAEASDKAEQWFYMSNNKKRICEHPGIAGITGSAVKLTSVEEPDLEQLETSGVSLGDPGWTRPPSLALILGPLEALRIPESDLYRNYTTESEACEAQKEGEAKDLRWCYRYGANQLELDGRQLDVGFSVDLTINPVAQAYAQQVAACYTGAQEVCKKLGVKRGEDKGSAKIGHKLLEDAVVRMAAIAIIDIKTGRIEALAGAFSPCARQDEEGSGRDAACEGKGRLPWTAKWRPERLNNPALFYDVHPASTGKPIMAAAFLADGAYGESLRKANAKRLTSAPALGSGLRRELMASDSKKFLERMFCFDEISRECQRPWKIQAMATQFGWNADCKPESGQCGQRDVLFGRPPLSEDDPVLGQMVMSGRLMTEEEPPASAKFHLIPEQQLSGKNLMDCRNNGWGQCKGESVPLVNEGWGQGNARVSPLGVAGMMAMLGASANGAKEAPLPHLVERVRGTGGELETAVKRFHLAPPQPVALSQEDAQIILGGLAWTHRGGTASRACQELWGEPACGAINWIAGKTGTPTFPADKVSLQTIAKACYDAEGKPNGKKSYCSSARPYKWYTGVFRLGDKENPQGQWNKAIAVLTERNWDKGSGRVQGAGDHGPNPSAEIALWVAYCLREKPQGGSACRPDRKETK